LPAVNIRGWRREGLLAVMSRLGSGLHYLLFAALASVEVGFVGAGLVHETAMLHAGCWRREERAEGKGQRSRGKRERGPVLTLDISCARSGSHLHL